MVRGVAASCGGILVPIDEVVGAGTRSGVIGLESPGSIRSRAFPRAPQRVWRRQGDGAIVAAEDVRSGGRDGGKRVDVDLHFVLGVASAVSIGQEVGVVARCEEGGIYEACAGIEEGGRSGSASAPRDIAGREESGELQGSGVVAHHFVRTGIGVHRIGDVHHNGIRIDAARSGLSIGVHHIKAAHTTHVGRVDPAGVHGSRRAQAGPVSCARFVEAGAEAQQYPRNVGIAEDGITPRVHVGQGEHIDVEAFRCHTTGRVRGGQGRGERIAGGEFHFCTRAGAASGSDGSTHF